MIGYNQEMIATKLRSLRMEWKDNEKKKGNPCTDEDFSRAVYCSRQSINKYERNLRAVPFYVLVEYCKACDCDIEYITGDQNCKRREVQRIVDITGLSENAAHALYNSSITADHAEMLNKLLEHPNFETLLQAIIEYASFHHNRQPFILNQNEFNGEAFIRYIDKETSSSMKKYIASDTFSRMIQDIHDDNEEIHKVYINYERLSSFISLIDDWKRSKPYRNYTEEQLRVIANDEYSELKKLWYPTINLAEYTAEDLINNDALRNSLSLKVHYSFYAWAEEEEKRLKQSRVLNRETHYIKDETIRFAPKAETQ